MASLVQTWWSAISGFFVDAASVFRGETGVLPVLALLAIACLIAGVVLAVLWRPRYVTRSAWLVIVALLAPVGVGAADMIMGWLGMLFAVLAGGLFLLIGTAVIANHAGRRLPVWLIGAFSIILAAYCAVVGGAFVSLTV